MTSINNPIITHIEIYLNDLNVTHARTYYIPTSFKK